jgi:hypothetical protein
MNVFGCVGAMLMIAGTERLVNGEKGCQYVELCALPFLINDSPATRERAVSYWAACELNTKLVCGKKRAPAYRRGFVAAVALEQTNHVVDCKDL